MRCPPGDWHRDSGGPPADARTRPAAATITGSRGRWRAHCRGSGSAADHAGSRAAAPVTLRRRAAEPSRPDGASAPRSLRWTGSPVTASWHVFRVGRGRLRVSPRAEPKIPHPRGPRDADRIVSQAGGERVRSRSDYGSKSIGQRLTRAHPPDCGFTEHDPVAVFSPDLRGLDRDWLRRCYSGYRWGGDERVCNPYDVLLLFGKREFGDYWFETGTPKFLPDTLVRRGVSTTELRESTPTPRYVPPSTSRPSPPGRCCSRPGTSR